jgi:excisionase family DNA binding protein
MSTLLDGRLGVNPEEAANLLGFSRAKVYQELKSGALPSRSFGRRRLITVEDLKKYISDHPVEYKGRK